MPFSLATRAEILALSEVGLVITGDRIEWRAYRLIRVLLVASEGCE